MKKQTKSFKAEMNLPKLIEQFGDDEKCRARLVELRWPRGVTCPRCQSKSISKVLERDQYDCNQCRYQFSATSGTIFHDTHLPLSKWFLAIYFMTARAPDPVSSASLSGFAQGPGYLIAAAGPLLTGFLHTVTGGWPVPVAALLVIFGVQLLAGWLAARDRVLPARAPA